MSEHLDSSFHGSESSMASYKSAKSWSSPASSTGAQSPSQLNLSQLSPAAPQVSLFGPEQIHQSPSGPNVTRISLFGPEVTHQDLNVTQISSFETDQTHISPSRQSYWNRSPSRHTLPKSSPSRISASYQSPRLAQAQFSPTRHRSSSASPFGPVQPESSEFGAEQQPGTSGNSEAYSRTERSTSQLNTRAVELQRLYLQTKTDMLGIIEEGLELKLEMQNIRDQFRTLIKDFEDLEKSDNKHRKKTATLLPPHAIQAVAASDISSTRGRVKAVYAARKARLRAKRPTLHERSCTQTHQSSTSSDSSSGRYEQNKENTMQPPNHNNQPLVTSTPDFIPSHNVPIRTMTWSVRRFLTPIKEENQEVFSTSRTTSKHHSSKRGSRKSSSRTKTRSSTLQNQTEGDYVTLKSLSKQSIKDYITQCHDSVHQNRRPARCVVTPTFNSPPIDSSVYVNPPESPLDLCSTNTVTTARSQGSRYSHSPHHSPPCDPVEELCTDTTLKDISQISHHSRTIPQEQVSSANLTGAFHSTFNYPLHSTMNYPHHSSFNLSDIRPDVDLRDKGCGSKPKKLSQQTGSRTLSEPNDIHLSYNQAPQQIVPHSRALDDSCMEYDSFNSADHSQFAPPELQFSPSSYKTPSKKPQATLCKEHGLHPTFGGPCIFADQNSFGTDCSTEIDLDENSNTPKAMMNITETDCDSSYLSECLDDHPPSIVFSEPQQYTYDQSAGCMRMLRRQTGQAELNNIKSPLGLSETDLIHDVTRKHLSLEATRASLPDISDLSLLPSASEMDEDERSESTLHASSPKKSHNNSAYIELDHANETLISLDPHHVSASTTDESPESNPSLQVPVNSPNITDSGGSSSRQNTDNYDYVEPPQQATEDAVAGVQFSSSGSHSSPDSSPDDAACYPPHRPHRESRTSGVPHPPSHHSGGENHSTKTGRTARSLRRSRSRHHSQDWDSGCSTYSSRPQSRHFTISDNTGRERVIVQHPPVTRNLTRERKKLLARRLRQFSNTFYKATSTGYLQIQTLGHF